LTKWKRRASFPKIFLKKEVPVDWNVRCETPAGKAWPMETPQASAEEAPGPPAESECLEWKSLHIPFCQKEGFYLNFKTKLIGAGVRDSCGNVCPRKIPQVSAEGGPSAERESPTVQSTQFCKPPKKQKKSISYDALVKNLILMLQESALPILKVCLIDFLFSIHDKRSAGNNRLH
jgi:hypothetical protein